MKCNCNGSERNFALIFFVTTVSYLTLSLDCAGGIHQALAQTLLQPVTVDAPAKPKARRTTPSQPSRSSASRAPRRAAEAKPVQPVPYTAPSTAVLGGLPAPYAGGQVATGASLGLLGNRSVMDTPFNQTSYTAKLIQDQQARTIRDVLTNDPSVRVIQAAGGGADSLFIRGFYYDSGDFALNGLYGIAPYYSTGANFIDRVEVLKGPSALLNGMTTGGTGVSSGGAVGGSVNLITKHAPDIDITQLTATYESKSVFGEQIDVSRRYGEHKEWGVRLNSTYSDGNTPWDHQNDKFGNAVLGVDYRGEAARLAVDFGRQTDNLNPPLRFFSASPAISPIIPPPPKAQLNFEPQWAYYRPSDTFLTARSEVDLTSWMTAYAAFGYHDSVIDYKFGSPLILNASSAGAFQLGGLRAIPFQGHETFVTLAGDTGVRATIDTGPINHQLNVDLSQNDRTYRQFVLLPTPSTPIFWNLYTPPTVADPVFATIGANQKTDVDLSSLGMSDTMSALNGRVQATVGVRRQTAGTDVQNALTPGSNRAEQDTTVWTPAYAVVVKPVESVSLYANYIQGLQTPVVVPAGFGNVGTVFPPAETKQKEVGVKIDAGRFTTTVSAFDIQMPSVITIAGTPPIQELNGLQRNRGIEVDVFGEITSTTRLLGGVMFIRGIQEATPNGLTNGRDAIGVPHFNANIGAEWDTPFVRDLTLTGKMIYTGRQYVDVGNTMMLPEWTRFDLGARYTFTSPWNGKPIVVRASMENVFNQAYWASAYSGVMTLGAPRTYLVSSTFNF
jgi:iron complex outermembrane recepter protein